MEALFGVTDVMVNGEMLNGSRFESAPAPFITDTCAVPAEVSSEAGRVAAICAA